MSNVMEKFKEGDIVEMKDTCSSAREGHKYRLRLDGGSLYAGFSIEEGIDDGSCSCESYWKLISSNNTIMSSVVEQFKVALLPEPEKTFRKLGITNGDNMLTEDGKTLFLNYLVNNMKEAFNKDVVSKLTAEEKKK